MINRERLNIPAALGRVPLFQEFSAELLLQIAATTQLRRLAKGEILFQNDDTPKGFFVVIFGQIKEAVRSAHGDEKIIEIVGPNQSFGETAMLLDRPYPYFAESLQDTLLVSIAKGIALDLLDTDASFAKRMLAGLSMRVHSLVYDIESYTLRTPEQRFIGYLIQNGSQKEHSDMFLKISLPAAKRAIASRLGMTPETFSRILGAFAEAGLIDVQGRHLSVPDVNRLKEFAL
ncbi:MAG: Crp/Fnr family transcriptional regulator [Rhodocyclaceae bacterium]|nr:Crp/Fnr family transcriptional regulator [Rhodocyclaceae bacterium]